MLTRASRDAPRTVSWTGAASLDEHTVPRKPKRVRLKVRVLALAATLTAGYVVLGAATAAAQESGPYPDVPSDAYYTAAVQELADKGVFAGTECEEGFCPNDPIDRATMAVWTVRVLDGADPLPVTATRFTDVDAAHRYAAFIERFVELGVTRGCGDGTEFCPDDTVTRAEMAIFLTRAFGLDEGPDPGFDDVSSDAWYASEVASLAASGITRGCGDGSGFCPDRATPRDQMAVFLHRAADRAWPPLVTIESAAPLVTRGNFEVTIHFSKPVTGLSRSEIIVVNGRAAGLTGSETRYTAGIEPSADGTVVVRLPAGAATTSNGIPNAASAPFIRTIVPAARSDTPGFDTWNRESVVQSSREEWLRQEPAWGYTGSVGDCEAGTTSQAFRDSVLQRVNWYRQMAGLDTVTEDPTLSATAQMKALIMLAQGALSHFPDTDWACYLEIDFQGENLGLGNAGTDGVDSYMQDSGDHNLAVGHRHLILSPFVTRIGTGNVRDATRRFRTANAMHFAGDWDLPPEVREARGFVAWPPPGYVPAETVWGRWSFSIQLVVTETTDFYQRRFLSGPDLAQAEVVVTDDDGTVPTEVIHRDGRLVWAIDGDTNSALVPPPLYGDRCYTVTISGVRLGGNIQAPYEYAVCAVAPYDYKSPTVQTPLGPQPNVGRLKAVTAGWGHTCGLRTDNTITCWGSNAAGQADAPTGTFKAVTAGTSHTCGLRTDNTITCWGDNYYGQADAPTGTFKAVTAGSDHTCGLHTDNTITCWGSNEVGQADAPTGTSHTCGLHADNITPICWGSNAAGQADAPAGTLMAVTAGWGHTCGLHTDNTITCWGYNEVGQADAPTGTFKAVTAGTSHTCGLRADNTITCWGLNHYGQADAPTGTFKAVTAGLGHTCGLHTDNTITCWGSNEVGQADAPTGTFKAVTAGSDHTCGLRTDGVVLCWGKHARR